MVSVERERPTGRNTTTDDDPRIVSVELLPGSLATNRALNRESSNTYPVLLHLSRPLDLFEHQALTMGMLVDSVYAGDWTEEIDECLGE